MIVRERPAAGEAAGALVLFHGRGADENDLFPLLDVLDPARRLHGYCPRGPLSLPPGGAHWYIVPRVGYPDPATFTSSYAEASEWLGSLPYSQVVLGGGYPDVPTFSASYAGRPSGSIRCRTLGSSWAGSRRAA